MSFSNNLKMKQLLKTRLLLLLTFLSVLLSPQINNRFDAVYAENPFLEVKKDSGDTQPDKNANRADVDIKPQESVKSKENPKTEYRKQESGAQNCFLYYLIKLQKKLNESVSGKMRELKSQKSLNFFFTLMLICFIYGIAHALGPGHGKSIISSWILASKRKLPDVVSASLLTALVHSFSAVILVLAGWYFLKKTVAAETENLKYYLQLTSGIILLFMGFYEIYKYIKGNLIDKDNGGEEDAELSEDEDTTKSGRLSSFAIALTAGIIPCPVTSLILIFAISKDLLWQGILFVISFATGMALAILGVTWTVWFLKEKANKTKFPVINLIVNKILPVMGGLALIIFAVIIIMTSKM